MATVTHCCKFIKPSKKFIQQLYKFLCTACRGQLGEAHNVCKQDAGIEGEAVTYPRLPWKYPSSLCDKKNILT